MRKTMILTAALAAVFAGGAAHAQGDKTAGKKGAAMCPVMKQAIKDPAKAPRLMVNNQPMAFCCAGCAPQVKKDPAKYIKTTKDPVTGKPFKVTASTPKMEHKGGLYLFSSARTHEQFHHNPEKYARSGHHGNHKSH